MDTLYKVRLFAWDVLGKVVEISTWYGYRSLDEAKTFAKEWYASEHVGLSKSIKIYQEGSRNPIIDYRNW